MIVRMAATESLAGYAYRGHMDDDGSAWMWVFGPLTMVLWIGLAAVLVWWLVGLANRRAQPPDPPVRKDPSGPEEVLAMRFARGEIDSDEYRERLDHVRGRHRGES